MIFVTAMAIGIATGLMRNAFCIALVAVLIGLAFALAALTSASFSGFTPLVIAIAGYNAGIFNLLIVGYGVQLWRERRVIG